MGQADVMKILGDEWISTKEIKNKLNGKRTTVDYSLRRLLKWGEVERKRVPIVVKCRRGYEIKRWIWLWRRNNRKTKRI